jgi:hypothetical protein
MSLTKKQMKSIYEKIGLIDISSKTERKNGTVKFFDETSQRNYIFRENSAPRVEYLSDKTKTIQSYALISTRYTENIEENMLMVLPTVTNNQVKSAYKRSLIALDISKNLVESFQK